MNPGVSKAEAGYGLGVTGRGERLEASVGAASKLEKLVNKRVQDTVPRLGYGRLLSGVKASL